MEPAASPTILPSLCVSRRPGSHSQPCLGQEQGMVPGLSEEVTLFPTAGPDSQAGEPPARVHPGWKSPRTKQADWGLEVDIEGW